MFDYNAFVESILPGNYTLTKSMELTKIQSSGTLWYTKKFLVLYYYVFLSNDIFTLEYIDKVTEAFDNFIDSLDDSVKEAAEKFFYPDDAIVNFKAPAFKSFVEFASVNKFANQQEKINYLQSAKKCYFALLMGSGGQRGVKKLFKEKLQSKEFVYSVANINGAILDSVITICTKECNDNKKIADNSVKYIISQEAMNQIVSEAQSSVLTEERVRQIIEDYPEESPKYKNIENDLVAFIRNERQILYYYGYYHSKSSGANDFEFSSLTPIGEIALNANAYEFLTIWEQQKLKMISQPPTADINNLPTTVITADKFEISYSPYLDIIDYLARNGSLSLEQYKYMISRKKHSFTAEEWQKSEKDILAKLDEIKEHIQKFGRDRDIADEDGRKELLKYMLGIRSDLGQDKGTNFLNVCEWSGNITVKDKTAIALMCRIYGSAVEYKLEKYESLFRECEADLRKRYKATVNGEYASISGSAKIHWDLYNIYPDRFVMMSVAITMACIANGISDIEQVTKEQQAAIFTYIKEHQKSLLKQIGIKTEAEIRKEINNVITAIQDNSYKLYTEMQVDNEETLAQYKEENATDLMTKLIEISSVANVNRTSERTRNSRLVGMLKSYYMNVYMHNNTLKCESCGEEAFITKAGEPYVEFHHLIPFNIAYGPDHYLNLFALCPVCHRKLHYLKETEKRETYMNLDNNNYFKKHFVDRLLELKKESLLRSYHLEYLFYDNAITQAEYDSIAA